MPTAAGSDEWSGDVFDETAETEGGLAAPIDDAAIGIEPEAETEIGLAGRSEDGDGGCGKDDATAETSGCCDGGGGGCACEEESLTGEWPTSCSIGSNPSRF